MNAGVVVFSSFDLRYRMHHLTEVERVRFHFVNLPFKLFQVVLFILEGKRVSIEVICSAKTVR